jgi:AcrR family transcriptional regulator
LIYRYIRVYFKYLIKNIPNLQANIWYISQERTLTTLLKNKDKILLSARKLFNERGFVNVRLQHISDDTIISVGNIAYHFKNKEAIVTALFSEWEKEFKQVFLEYRHTPIFENVDRIFSSIQQVQESHSFFFTDLVEIYRAYPKLFRAIRQFMDWQTIAFEEIIRFNVARASFVSLDSEAMTFLARLLTQSINNWPTMGLLGSVESISEGKLGDYIWQILQAYMTASGKTELSIFKEQKISLNDIQH